MIYNNSVNSSEQWPSEKSENGFKNPDLDLNSEGYKVIFEVYAPSTSTRSMFQAHLQKVSS